MNDNESKNHIGKLVLVGVTYLDHERNLIEQIQLAGNVIRISETGGIVLQLDSGEEYTLPPDLTSLQTAPKGEYRLRSTGKIIVDPDYLTSWTITKPPPAEKSDE
ncbi:hypothetical protein BH24ACI3_BH24ACI3_06000 [soil metagenome]